MQSKKWLSILKLIPFTLCILLILCYLIFGKEISVQTIIDYTPKSPFLATIILLLMYGFKSISIVFPLIILEIAGGHLFPTIPAIIINTIGIMICHVVAYWIGHISGTAALEKLVEKHSIIETIIQNQNNNSFFICFLLRTLYCLPGDIVSMYLGAAKTPFKCYLFASTLGTLPSTILATLFGASITEPSSPMFWISVVLMTLFAGASWLFYHIYKKKTSRQIS